MYHKSHATRMARLSIEKNKEKLMLLGSEKYKQIASVNTFVSLKMYLGCDFWNMFLYSANRHILIFMTYVFM